jgi:hypothetical protein
MIEHADAALEAWLSTLDPPVDIAFERPDDGPGSSRANKKPVLALVLTSIKERLDKRDNRVTDLRATDGRVVGRQNSTRFFELDYLCTVSGSPLDAHRALGDLLQLIVDNDTVPVAHLPTELADLGYPIDIQLVTPPMSVAAVAVRLVLPVDPTPNRQIGPPTTSLHLDMGPPPKPRGKKALPVAPESEASTVPMGERKWTTVRRRELIGREQHAAAKAADAATSGKPAKG